VRVIFLIRPGQHKKSIAAGDGFRHIHGSALRMAVNHTAPRELVHLELHTPNLGRACAFYSKLLTWRPERIEAAGGAYQALELGGDVGGGVVECGTARARWLPYIEVASVRNSTERAHQLGAWCCSSRARVWRDGAA
jgi:predicted enzyme related to lactoylglutathione lyase